MTFKSLILGSAAAMMVAGAANAADLTVAEPVDYVKVCDAFGKGFFYSPGTDTCIKVGGYVKFGT
ncbi:MAG: porin, partial [Rhizobiales bacterium]|nr:porin [Hyphomicrobiales bacterium]